jgi:hypothetical protein
MADLLQRDDPNGCHTFDLWTVEFDGSWLDWADAVRATFEDYLTTLDPEDAARWIATVEA